MPIKPKGVCGVCKTEFDLAMGSFEVELETYEKDAFSPRGIKILVYTIEKEPEELTKKDCEKFVVCGKHCLLRHIDKSLGGDTAVLNGHEFGQEDLT